MLVVQLASLLGLCALLRIIGRLRGALWQAAAGLAAFCWFRPSQWENDYEGSGQGRVSRPL